MGRCNFTSLLQRSATVRLAARAVVFVLLVGILVGAARFLQTHITIESVGATTAVVAALVVLEAALFLFVARIFKNII
jgi:hypothetical protein